MVCSSLSTDIKHLYGLKNGVAELFSLWLKDTSSLVVIQCLMFLYLTSHISSKRHHCNNINTEKMKDNSSINTLHCNNINTRKKNEKSNTNIMQIKHLKFTYKMRNDICIIIEITFFLIFILFLLFLSFYCFWLIKKVKKVLFKKLNGFYKYHLTLPS